MKVKFLKDSDTMRYGRIAKDETVTVKDEDGKAFVNNGIAKKVKGVKDDA